MNRERPTSSKCNSVLGSLGTDFPPPPILSSLWQPSTAACTTLRQIDHALQSEDGGGGELTTAHPLSAFVPPNWALRCTAGRASNIEQHLLEGARLEKSPQGLTRVEKSDGSHVEKFVRGLPRCRFVGCPYCHREVLRRHRRELTDRVADARAAGLTFAHLTFTVPSVPLGSLREQRRLISQGVAHGLRHARRWRSMAGHVYADHLTFNPYEGWHDHRHVMLVGSSPKGVLTAGKQAVDAFRSRLQAQGARPTDKALHVKLAPRPDDFVAYLTRFWPVGPDPLPADPTLSPFNLAARALLGDELSRMAFIEVSEAIARQSLFRGWGLLGPAGHGSRHP